MELLAERPHQDAIEVWELTRFVARHDRLTDGGPDRQAPRRQSCRQHMSPAAGRGAWGAEV
jgi:hypothetical protein